jgi:hypothetical protein
MQRGLVVPILGFTLVAWLGGCTADSGDGGILVLKNVLADATCKVTASETEAGISHGSLELLVPSGYQFIAQMRSRITAFAEQLDQRTIVTSGANVDIAFPGSTLFSAAELAELQAMALTRRKTLFTAAIRPGGLTDAGFELIPAALTARIKDKAGDNPIQIEAVATFTVVGDMSGQEVTSQPFSFPVTIGTGEVMNIAGACPLPRSFGMVRNGYACNPFQDGVVDCCTTGTGTETTLRCPAILDTM